MEDKKTILIIEDERSHMQAMHDKFVHEGFEVLEAFDGEEGINLALEKHPNLILLDLIMPKMGGIEMLKKLREDPWGSTAPVIILSNRPETVNIQEGQKQNIVAFFIKQDWKLEDIVKKIKEKLKSD